MNAKMFQLDDEIGRIDSRDELLGRNGFTSRTESARRTESPRDAEASEL